MTTTNTYNQSGFASKNCQGSAWGAKVAFNFPRNFNTEIGSAHMACKKKGVTRLFDQLAHYECFNTVYSMLICCIMMTEQFTKL